MGEAIPALILAFGILTLIVGVVVTFFIIPKPWTPRQEWLRRSALIGGIAAFASILVLTACVSTPSELRDPFEKVIGARLDPLVQLVTNRDQYSDGKPVVYQVVNRKTVPVYFPDYSYGIQAYVYDHESQEWKLFPWKFGLIDPKPVVVVAGTGRGTENTYVIDMMFMPPSGKVRLVVVGWLDPTNSEGSKIAAFTDIEIVR